ncbi:MAG: hypothetical protein K2N33_03010 [Clostridia bacterium]|nr:hypothetical protein [Clostridia bacterium]
MATIEGNLKKWKRGELCGNIALYVCAAALVYFIAGFAVGRSQNIYALELATEISAPIILAAAAFTAAFCSIFYGGAIDKSVKKYVLQTFVENAELMHPERNSLSFYLSCEGSTIYLQVNGYKEKIAFDFSPLGKLSLMRKVSALSEIENRLCATFCRLYERGASYKEISYAERAGTRRKSGKTVYVIKSGEPDVKAFKQYLKNK